MLNPESWKSASISTNSPLQGLMFCPPSPVQFSAHKISLELCSPGSYQHILLGSAVLLVNNSLILKKDLYFSRWPMLRLDPGHGFSSQQEGGNGFEETKYAIQFHR